MGEVRVRILTEAPTFGKTVCARTDRRTAEPEIGGDDDVGMDDFEFAFIPVESGHGGVAETPADEIFLRGRILPVYPALSKGPIACGCGKSEEVMEGIGRAVLLGAEKRVLRSGSASSSSTMSSEVDGTEGLEAAYCAWTPRSPSPPSGRWKKSRSTGSDAPDLRRFRLRDLVMGRSRSDGKEKLAHFPAADKEMKCDYRFSILGLFLGRSRSGAKENLDHSPSAEKEVTGEGFARPNPTKQSALEAEKRGKNGKATEGGRVNEFDMVTAHRVFYGKRTAGSRRRFVPYRQDLLLGFFGRGKHRTF